MNNKLVFLALTFSLLTVAACKKKDEDTAVAAPAQPAAATTSIKMIELDISAFGPEFKGYIISAPEGAVVDSDKTSHHIKWGEAEYIAVEEAPYWNDGVEGLKKDKDNQNIVVNKNISARWERTPPLGKSWLVDVLVKVGNQNFSCDNGSLGTFANKETADLAESMCKSIKKR